MIKLLLIEIHLLMLISAKLNNTEQRVQLQEYFIKNWNAMFCCKSRAWESENEFRWLIHSEEDSQKFIPFDDV